MNSKFNFHVKPKLILFILTAVCIGSIAITYFRQDSAVSVGEAVGYLVVPMQKGINSIGTWLYDRTQDRLDLEEAKSQIAQLEQDNQELKDNLEKYQDASLENRRLRELLELKDTYKEYETVGASIVAKNSGNWYSSFTIDKGTNDGLALNMNVIADGGLVGLITEIGPNFSVVTSIIDDGSRVSGMIKSTQSNCIVTGDLSSMENGLLKLDYIQTDFDISEDNLIVTSNISDKYVPGIVIGYATNVTLNDDKLTQSGYLEPAVDFSNLSEKNEAYHKAGFNCILYYSRPVSGPDGDAAAYSLSGCGSESDADCNIFFRIFEGTDGRDDRRADQRSFDGCVPWRRHRLLHPDIYLYRIYEWNSGQISGIRCHFASDGALPDQ